MRETHERFEAMDESSVIMIGLNQERVIQAIDHIMNTKSYVQNLHIPEDYSVDNVSVKTVRIIMSYIDYVNRVVWSK
jgi:UDP-N-acetylglucosamine 2-epimerase (non-hydrolysing)